MVVVPSHRELYLGSSQAWAVKLGQYVPRYSSTTPKLERSQPAEVKGYKILTFLNHVGFLAINFIYIFRWNLYTNLDALIPPTAPPTRIYT